MFSQYEVKNIKTGKLYWVHRDDARSSEKENEGKRLVIYRNIAPFGMIMYVKEHKEFVKMFERIESNTKIAEIEDKKNSKSVITIDKI